MLINPFTPSEIAGNPSDFFGRSDELSTLERSLMQGSVVIQGPMGIGKSSLLARARLLMEGFGSLHHSRSVVAVGDRDVQTVDQAARLVLEEFVSVDQRETKLTFKLGSVVERTSAEVCRYFSEGRHLAALKRIVEQEYLEHVINDLEFLILAVDEADKCAIPLTRLIRSVSTHAQQQGAKRLRFLLAGVSPFYQKMVEEDPGISRFFYKTITLEPLAREDATDLIETKLGFVVKDAERAGIRLGVEPDLIARIVALSGGHPHLLQLLGSHVVESEETDPDGVLDAHDLLGALRRICYEDRARVYDSILHKLEVEGKREYLEVLLDRMSSGFPARIDRRKAVDLVGKDAVHWLVEHSVLSTPSPRQYGLADEFLRVRLFLDEAESDEDEEEIEETMVRGDVVGWHLLEEGYPEDFG